MLKNRRRARTFILAPLVCCMAAGCKDLAGTPDFPAGTPDPGTLRNAAGARAMYQSAVTQFGYSTGNEGAYLTALLEGGLLADEFQASNLGGPPLAYGVGSSTPNIEGDYPVDARQIPERQVESPVNDLRVTSSYAAPYNALQRLRGRARQAIGALAAYAPEDSALRGHLYAMQGYAELLLADLFCSGIPLSTLDYDADYTYRAGSTTRQVYQHAAALLDTAIALSNDSARVQNLARVGRGRALVNLGVYDTAAAVVRSVPDDFQYQFPVSWGLAAGGGPPTPIFARWHISVSNREGANGFPYRTSGDPRTRADSVGHNDFRSGVGSNLIAIYFPNKYGDLAATSSVTVASGIEARLIETEAALHGVSVGRDWLDILNDLRQRYAPAPVRDSVLVDPGSGSTDARVDVLFAERAAWLFADGHRQGDLRRLVRSVGAGGYGRSQSAEYPSGPYTAVFQQYGSHTNLPIPAAEHANPLFTGCISRGS